MEWIIKYKVRRTLRNCSITLATCNTLERAKETAKDQLFYRDQISIEKYRYTSEENLKKDFNFDSSYIWSACFHGWEEINSIKDSKK